MRIGIGYDVHAFHVGRPLFLGGVRIEGATGLAGWSDGDVLSHAIADSLLGAAGLGDLGVHFPKESFTEGASSLDILAQTSQLLEQENLTIENIDSTVVVQKVEISSHRDRMVSSIAEALKIDQGRVSVKATTTDRLGAAGRGEGIAAMAVSLLS